MNLISSYSALTPAEPHSVKKLHDTYQTKRAIASPSFTSSSDEETIKTKPFLILSIQNTEQTIRTITPENKAEAKAILRDSDCYGMLCFDNDSADPYDELQKTIKRIMKDLKDGKTPGKLASPLTEPATPTPP